MTDKLNELGKSLGRMRSDSEAALRRHNLIIPRVERTRDIFDSSIPFEMIFEKNESDQSMALDLDFNKPPPMRSCYGVGPTTKCETYALGAGDHLIQLLYYPYVTGSLTIFRNGIQLTTSNYNEYDRFNGLVFVQGLDVDPQFFSICYITEYFTQLVDCGDNIAGYGSAGASGLNLGLNEFCAAQALYDPNGTFSNSMTPYDADYTAHFSAEAYASAQTAFGIATPQVDGESFGTDILFVGSNPHVTLFAQQGSATIQLRCATDIDYSRLDFNTLIGNAIEYITATVTFGHFRFVVSFFHGRRTGIFPVLGPFQDPTGEITYYTLDNLGHVVTTSPTFPIGFNTDIPVYFQVSDDENKAIIIAGENTLVYDKSQTGGSFNSIDGFGVEWSWQERHFAPAGATYSCGITGAVLNQCLLEPFAFE